MDIDRAVFSHIKEVLKANPRGMNVTEIAREIGMNRLSVAKYMEILVVSGHVDVKAFGPAKVYYISNRLPISAMLSLSSDLILILDKDLNIINMNDEFLAFSGIKREDILYKKIENFSFPLEFSPSMMPNMVEALNGKDSVAEAYHKRNGKQLYFNIKFIPLVLDDGQKGVIIIFENITERKRIELAIQESERKLRSVIEQSMDAVTLTDERGAIIEYNKGAEETLGIARSKAIGMNIWDLQFSISMHESKDQAFYEALRSSINKLLKSGNGPGVNQYIEKEIIRPDKSRRTIHIFTFPIKTEKGYMICGITRDITDMKRAELEIRESEERFRAIFEQAAVGIAFVGQDDRILKTNGRFCEILGYTPAELKGLTYRDITDPEDIDLSDKYVRMLRSGNIHSYSFEKRYVCKDGRKVWANVTVSSLHLTDSENYHVIIIEDISNRKQIEDALRKAEAHMANAQRTAHLGSWEVVFKDPSRSFENADVRWSEELYRILGVDPTAGNTSFKSLLDSIHPYDRDTVIRMRDDLLHNKRSNSYDVRVPTAGAGEKILHCEAGVALDDKGNVTKLFGTMQDVTERRRMEESLRLASFALDNAADLIALIKPDGRIYYVNDSFCNSLGYIRDELLRMNAMDVDISFTDDSWAAGMSLIKTEGYVAHLESGYRAKDGSIIPVEIVGRFIEFNGEGFICASARNITERKRIEDALRKAHDELEKKVDERTLQLKQANEALHAEISKQIQIEEALRFSENKFRSLVENLSDAVWEIDDRLAFTYMSQKVFAIIGFMPEEVIGKTPYDLMGPEEAKRVKGLLYKVATEKVPFTLLECKILHKNGQTVDVEISGDPIFSSSGAILGFRGITRDVTQRNKNKEELSAVNRSLRLLSDCNRALIRSTDEQALLTDICNILVETGGYRLAWVGYKELDAEKSIRRVASAGDDKGYLDAIKLFWSADTEGGMGPGGMAIRNSSPCILRWDGPDGQFKWWRKEALERGITSIIGLPLMENGQAFGTLLIYSDKMDAFSDTEVELLKELTDNMSYGVAAIRVRSRR